MKFKITTNALGEPCLELFPETLEDKIILDKILDSRIKYKIRVVGIRSSRSGVESIAIVAGQ